MGTHLPSSLNIRTPASTISPISARDSPSRPFVIAPTGNTSQRPTAAARSRTSWTTPGVVRDRLGVGHRRDRRVPADRRRARAGLDRLLVLEAGLAQMRVHVDQARRHDQPAAVDDLGVVRLESTARRSRRPTRPRRGRPRRRPGRPPDRRSRPPRRTSRSLIGAHSPSSRRASGRGATCAPRCRSSPAPRSRSAAGRRRRSRSPHLGSSDRGA